MDTVGISLLSRINVNMNFAKKEKKIAFNSRIRKLVTEYSVMPDW